MMFCCSLVSVLRFVGWCSYWMFGWCCMMLVVEYGILVRMWLKGWVFY